MRIRHHVNPLKANFLVPRTGPLDLPAGREVEAEIGCAEAQWLFERAAQDPRRVEIGLEIRAELVSEVNRQAEATGFDVRAIFANANVDVARLFAPGSLDRVFVNFPDPWFKRRHQKRRLLDDALAADLVRALRPGGDLFFQSDVWDLALDALAVLEAQPELANVTGPWSFLKGDHPYGVRSRREDECQRLGRPIWRMLYRRSG